MEVFDKEGKPVEGVFSQAELDAKIAEAVAAKPADAPAEKPAAPAAPAAPVDEMPAWAKELKASVDSLNQGATKGVLNTVTAMLDADKKKEVEAKFESLQGYDSTPEGLARRAEDAHLLVTGERYNANSVNMQNLAALGGAPANTKPGVVTEQDKQIQSALGVTPEDVAKFGKK